MPTELRALLAPDNKTPDETACRPATVACLKKVIGLQSLNIELTWRPFNYGTSIPSAEELADVERLPALCAEAEQNADDANTKLLQGLLGGLDTPVGEQPEDGAFDNDPPIEWKLVLGDSYGAGEAVLTRAERRRLAPGGYSQVSDVTEVDNIILEETESHGKCGVPPIRAHKRRKVDLERQLEPPSDFSVAGSQATGPAAETEFPSVMLYAQPSHSANLGTDTDNFTAQMRSMNSHALESEPNMMGGCQEKPEGTSWPPDAPSEPENWRDQVVNARSVEFCNELQRSLSQNTAATGRLPDFHDLALSPSAGFPPASQAACMISHKQSPSVNSSAGFHQSAVDLLSKKATWTEKNSARQSLSDFMKFRGKISHEVTDIPSSPPDRVPEECVLIPESPPHGFPDELRDLFTLSIPEDWTPPTLRHRYIASLELLQKRVLTRHLASPDCNIELVERETHGVDLITDAETAVLFVPLAPLPATCETLLTKLAELSWAFARLVVVFEGFSSSLSYRAPKDEAGKPDLAPYAYSPAVLKAIKKLKRILKISEALDTGNKRETTSVWYGYAGDPGEAAKFARLVGDIPVNGTGSAHGDEREWLTDEFDEDEMDLARVKGMNAFAAALILRCVDLNTLLEMDPHRRFQMFFELVGEQRMLTFNEEVAKRLADVATLSSPPLSPAVRTATASTPFAESFEDGIYMDSIHTEEGVYGGYSHHTDGMHGSSSHHTKGLHKDNMDWQTTGLPAVPTMRKGQDSATGNYL